MGIFSQDMPAATSYSGGGSGDPASMGGVPAVMPSNDWWKNATDLAGRALDTYAKVQASKNQTGIAAPAGRISSSPINPSPGAAGLWFQNSSTPGARGPNSGGMMPGMSNQTLMIAGALVLVVVLVLVRRHG